MVDVPSDEHIIDATANKPIIDVPHAGPYFQVRQKIIHIACFEDKTIRFLPA
jgi:hypothetical protein